MFSCMFVDRAQKTIVLCIRTKLGEHQQHSLAYFSQPLWSSIDAPSLNELGKKGKLSVVINIWGLCQSMYSGSCFERSPNLSANIGDKRQMAVQSNFVFGWKNGQILLPPFLGSFLVTSTLFSCQILLCNIPLFIIHPTQLAPSGSFCYPYSDIADKQVLTQGM